VTDGRPGASSFRRFATPMLFPCALASVLDRDEASVEVLVVGDGVEDATCETVARHADDPRVRFFDFPKGPRNGEAYRHEVLREARGHAVCSPCDDDLLLRDLSRARCACSRTRTSSIPHPPRILPGGELQFFPWSYGRPEVRESGRVRAASIALTGSRTRSRRTVGSRSAGGRRRPGCRPTTNVASVARAPGVRMACGERPTHLNFLGVRRRPAPLRRPHDRHVGADEGLGGRPRAERPPVRLRRRAEGRPLGRAHGFADLPAAERLPPRRGTTGRS